ncbi:type II toxin-antitoxin system RelE/ParE family toxin [Candidatus Woesearchaeota archaeon]|nr:type II toxin-antitoxin system RelE/ParE family toxin [Candidatus Woesearchaeota archaeon]
MYELLYSDTSLKQLQKLEKSVQQRMIRALERLRIRPESYDIKKLVGMPGFRFRIGDYRIIFDIDREKLHILILQIGHRKNIYN